MGTLLIQLKDIRVFWAYKKTVRKLVADWREIIVKIYPVVYTSEIHQSLLFLNSHLLEKDLW